MQLTPYRILTAACLLLFTSAAFAANGIFLTAYGANATALGGADIAAIEDTNALIANPAGLANIQNSRIDYTVTGFSISEAAHDDEFNSERKVANELGGILGFGYAFRPDKQPFVIGGGITVSGGLGYNYNNLNTAFGTRDNVSSMFSLFRFSLGSAWDISDRLRAGIVFASTYASAEQELFYDTSIAEGDSVFFGVKVRELSGWGVDVKVGLQYDLTENITAGINYTSASKIDLDDGRMSVNYSALGLGRVRYNDVNMKGLELPQEFGLGLSWRIDDHWKVFTEANWFDWENSTGALTITAGDPNSETPPEAKKLRQRSTVKMNSEIVYSFGIEKTLGIQRSIMAGYSYHDLVIDRQSLSPTFALIPQHDFSVGYKTPLSSNWLINLALAYQPRLEESYNNPELPFGKSAEINQSIAIHVTITSVK